MTNVVANPASPAPAAASPPWVPRACAGALSILTFVWLLLHFAPAIAGPDTNGYVVQARLIATEGKTHLTTASPAQFVGMHWLETADGVFHSRYPAGLPLLFAAAWKIGGLKAALLVKAAGKDPRAMRFVSWQFHHYHLPCRTQGMDFLLQRSIVSIRRKDRRPVANAIVLAPEAIGSMKDKLAAMQGEINALKTQTATALATPAMATATTTACPTPPTTAPRSRTPTRSTETGTGWATPARSQATTTGTRSRPPTTTVVPTSYQKMI